MSSRRLSLLVIDVARILECFKSMEESGVALEDCVLVDKSDGEMPPNTEFIVMSKKDFQRNANLSN